MPEAESIQAEKKNDEKRRCTIRGRVTYVRGSVPLAKVIAQLLPTSSELTGAQAESVASEVTGEAESVASEVTGEAESATTDIAGAYQISNLNPGIYEVTVTPPKGWNYVVKPQRLELAPGDVKVADFRLEKKAPETLLLTRVFDSDGAPVVGAELKGVLCGGSLESGVTDSDGRFIFKNVTPGKRFVRVNMPGHLGQIREFTIEEGQKISLDITLEKAQYRIYGAVTNEEGKPVSAAVSLFQNQVVIQKIQTTEKDGGFEFAAKEGQYAVLVQAPSYELFPWNGLVSEDKNVNFKLVRLGKRIPRKADMDD